MNIVDLFLAAATKYPDNIAIVEKDNTISYDQLKQEVLATAAYFKKKGITEGDRVLVFIPMSIDLYRVVLALFYLGATAVFLDEWVSKKRLELCCNLASCKGFIGVFKARVYSFFSKELRQIKIKLNLGTRGDEQISVAQVNPDLSALITFTTGSSGTPKAALRTHGFLNEQFDALLEEIEPKATDIDMPVLPIVLFVNLGVGSTSVIANFNMAKPNSMDTNAIDLQLNSHKVNRITASPYFIKRLAQHAIDNNTAFNNIEKVFTGGAPVFPHEAKLYQKGFPNSISKVIYGSTEVEPISSILVPELIKRAKQLAEGLPVGQLFSRSVVKIIQILDDEIPVGDDFSFENIIVAEGEIGEIIVSGPHVLKQYYNNEQAFRKNKIVVGDTVWHRTGDSGFMKGKELFLTGPCSQLVSCKSGYLSPFIIENQLQNLEGVTAGTIINLSGINILVIEGKFEKEKLDQLVAKNTYEKIVAVKKIPRDPRHNSKIDYKKLEQQLLA